MDTPTRKLSEYVKDNGVNLSKLSKGTGIPYISIYDSLANKKRTRNLRVGEFFRICIFLEVDPMKFSW